MTTFFAITGILLILAVIAVVMNIISDTWSH